MDPVLITASMNETTFAEMVSCSSRQIREILFSQMNIKPKKKSLSLKVHEKRDERVRRLHERLKTAAGKKESDICRELIRTWLYTKRPMLKSALDFLGIENEDGLVSIETDFFNNLSADKVKALKEHLEKSFPLEHALIYLQFMEVPHLE